MKAKGRRYIQVRVDVVNVVKAPEEGKPVEQSMPVIEREIKKQEGDDDLEPAWPSDPVSDSEAVSPRPSGGSQTYGDYQQSHGHHGSRCDG